MARPNLLFLFTDEQRFDTLAGYGNTTIQMPNLNRLAETSIVFEQAYVTQPVCTPSRASILTGLYPHTNRCTQNNVSLPEEVACLPELMTDGDYATGYHGKWHLGDEVFGQHGFDEWVSIEDFYTQYYSPGRDGAARSSYHAFLVQQGLRPANGDRFTRGEAARLPEPYGKPAFLAREASRFIRQNRDRPFVLYVNFLEPHMPFFGPRDDQYDPAEVWLPPNFDCPPTDQQPLKTRLFERGYFRRGHSGLPLQTEAHWRRMIANYWGLCSLVDTHAGTILDTLRECGLWDNTIIVFTSDHGDMMGSHRLLAKCVMFEEAIRVPLLLHLPGQTEARRIRGPVSQIDLVPTLLDLMDQSLPDGLQGKGLRRLLGCGGNAVGQEDVFIEWNGPNNGFGADKLEPTEIPSWMAELASKDQIERAIADPVRTVITPDGWKFNCSPLGEHELYNLSTDPLETHNLASDRQYQAVMQDLLERIRRWQDNTLDSVKLPPIAAR